MNRYVLTNLPGDLKLSEPPRRKANLLPLPALLAQLLGEGRWRQPSDECIADAIPVLSDPVDFLSERGMRSESSIRLDDDPRFPNLHEYRGSEGEARPLPWRDVELSLLIAVNREIGVDIAIALDYRTGFDDPRVLASEWVGSEILWCEIFPSFTAFVSRFNL